MACWEKQRFHLHISHDSYVQLYHCYVGRLIEEMNLY